MSGSESSKPNPYLGSEATGKVYRSSMASRQSEGLRRNIKGRLSTQLPIMWELNNLCRASGLKGVNVGGRKADS